MGSGSDIYPAAAPRARAAGADSKRERTGSPKPDTQTLMAAAQARDRAAVERLLVIFQPDARHIAYSQCASLADAEDAAQETLLVIYKRIGALRTIASFPAWMFSIVRNECRRLVRSSREQTNTADATTRLPAAHSTPERHSDPAAAIQSLPAKYREAIALRDFHRYSIAEIAEQTRLTRAAVKSRIHRARDMIRESLIEYRPQP